MRSSPGAVRAALCRARGRGCQGNRAARSGRPRRTPAVDSARAAVRRASRRSLVLLLPLLLAACDAEAGPGRARPGRPAPADAPREVNLIAKDYSFLPDVLDLVPGETVLLHVVNGGLEVHEAVIGDGAVQDAWEAAEAAAAGAPPGPTPS